MLAIGQLPNELQAFIDLLKGANGSRIVKLDIDTVVYMYREVGYEFTIAAKGALSLSGFDELSGWIIDSISCFPHGPGLVVVLKLYHHAHQVLPHQQ